MSRFKLPGSNRRHDTQQAAATPAVTERLPLLAEALQRTAEKPRRVLMDFAPASAASLETFNPLACRLRLLEFPELRQQLARAQGPEQFQALVRQHLPPDADNPCNLILCWDYLNYLPRGPISLLMDEIAQHAQPGALVHLVVAYSDPLMPDQPCHFTPKGRDSVIVAPHCEGTREAPRYAPNDLMRCMPRYKIDKAMLLRNGYQEYILRVRDEDDTNQTAPINQIKTTTRQIDGDF